jgi:aryl-alcohol dehydrogenase-like predicted oxidoreductase
MRQFAAMPLIRNTDLDVHPICLGGNVFGWTADKNQSFQVLDAYVASGGNFIDTADSYSAFAPGNHGGESETILGEWLATDPVKRDKVVIATKVGQHPERKGLKAANVKAAVEDSLRRLQTDRIDLQYAHIDDLDTPLEETLGAFDELVKAGKVRHIAASNHTAPRLAEALAISKAHDWASYVALQPQYSLVSRGTYEGELESLCAEQELACFPYWGLAAGYLTGKYRDTGVESARAGIVRSQYDNAHGADILAAIDPIAAAHEVPLGVVALGWLLAKPTIPSVIASARNLEQLEQLLPAATVSLTAAELARLDEASQRVQVVERNDHGV